MKVIRDYPIVLHLCWLLGIAILSGCSDSRNKNSQVSEKLVAKEAFQHHFGKPAANVRMTYSLPEEIFKQTEFDIALVLMTDRANQLKLSFYSPTLNLLEASKKVYPVVDGKVSVAFKAIAEENGLHDLNVHAQIVRDDDSLGLVRAYVIPVSVGGVTERNTKRTKKTNEDSSENIIEMKSTETYQ